MKAEKIILSFVAVFVGLVAAGVAFYFYQSSKAAQPIQPNPKVAVKSAETKPSPAANTNTFTIESPKDEEVFTKKIITISGKTVKGATITVSGTDADQVVQPADNGDFTMTQTIPDGTSIIQFTVIFPDGTQKTMNRTVTFSTENF